MSHRSPTKRMEGSDYEDKCSQRADDVGWMSNREKRKVSPRNKRIGVNRNITPLLSPRQRRGYLELVVMVRRLIVKVVPRFVGHAIIDVGRGQGATAASR